jgi:hypothetical protein
MSDNELSDEEWLRRTRERHDREAEEDLAAAKAEAVRVGREPFDSKKLSEYWVYPGSKLSEVNNAEYMKELETQYYIFCKSCKTMKEFADQLWIAELRG